MYVKKRRQKENVSIDENLNTDIGIGGSLQKRDHSLLNGVATGIARENKRVIDYKMFSKFCNSEKVKKGLRKERYVVWKDNHRKDCEINHF